MKKQCNQRQTYATMSTTALHYALASTMVMRKVENTSIFMLEIELDLS